VAVVDATFFSADELPGRDLSLIPHPLVTDTVERFAGIGTRIILTHLNHSNPVGDPESAEAALVAAAGMEVATDGLEIGLS
jgi:pyrroloquinoline quinone biosynthesis protein B